MTKGGPPPAESVTEATALAWSAGDSGTSISSRPMLEYWIELSDTEANPVLMALGQFQFPTATVPEVVEPLTKLTV